MDDLNIMLNDERFQLVTLLSNSVKNHFADAMTPGGNLQFYTSVPDPEDAAPDFAVLGFKCHHEERMPVPNGLYFSITMAHVNAQAMLTIPIAIISRDQAVIDDEVNWFPLMVPLDFPGNFFEKARVPVDGESYENGWAPFSHFEKNLVPELIRTQPANPVQAIRSQLKWQASLS